MRNWNTRTSRNKTKRSSSLRLLLRNTHAHLLSKRGDKVKLTRRGRIVANIAACVAVLAFCTLMGLVGYLEGL